MSDLTTSRARGSLVPLLVSSVLCLLCAGSAAADLPDGRAYEQVSPVDKNGADIASTFGAPYTGVHVAADGNGVAYFAATPFISSPNGIITTFYRSTRAASGWSTSPLSSPLPVPGNGLDIEYVSAFRPDLSQAIFASTFPYDAGDIDGSSPPPAVGAYDEYLFGGASPNWLSHGTVGGDAPVMAIFAGASNDLSHAFFETTEKLLPGLPDLSAGQYVYERNGDELTLVNADNGGDLLDVNGGTVGNGHPSGFEPNFDSGWARNAVSDDGTKVFLESPDPNSGSPAQLYLRDTAAGTTTPVSNGDGTHSALFAGAADDGSKAFFLTDEQLTGDDTDTDMDVYEYDTASDTLTRASHGSGAEDANVAGVAWVSDNGAHLYFVAMNQIAGGGTPGEPNLYRYDTATDATTFVTTLSPDDSSVWSGDEQGHNAFGTPDGRTLVFVSDANLTSYDAQGHREVYVYRTFPGSLACASCRTNGTPPTGDADIGYRSDPGFSHGWVTPVGDDGRVFFNTTDTLVGDDVNGNAGGSGAQDVYEYADGVPSLISDGRSVYGSSLAGVGPSGKDVFFYTRAALVASDVDGGELDVYDARAGGGFPPPAGAPAPCGGDACHGTPAPAPFLPVPGTGGTQGDDTVLPAPSFSVTAISSSAARHAARTGKLVLTVRVTAPGRITASAFGRVGGKTRRVATTHHTFGAAGTANLTLNLSRSARAQLRRNKRLGLRIDVKNSQGLMRTAHVTLRRSSR